MKRDRTYTGKPSVSIIVPTLNEERYLPRLLESLMRTHGRRLEILVVDGRSEDRTLEIVERVSEVAPPWITLRALTSDVRNVSVQRNLGAARARHDLLVFLDADTAIPSSRVLDHLLDRFRKGRFAVASCRFRPLERDPRGEIYYAFLYAFHRLVERWNPYALGACLVVRRAVFVRSGGFDPTIRINEDADFCARCSRFGRFGVLPVALRISTRRFAKHGYLRMGLQYLRIFLDRTFRGEARDGRIRYEFGHYD